MLPAGIHLNERLLKMLLEEGLAADGQIKVIPGSVSFSYDAGAGNSMDPGNGLTASLSISVVGERASLYRSESQIKTLVAAALTARGFKMQKLGVCLSYDRGGGTSFDSGNGARGTAYIELPDRMVTA